MRPRPLYRWKSFWFGLLILAFIGWAWWDSFWWLTSIECNAGMAIRFNEASYLVIRKQWQPTTNWSVVRESYQVAYYAYMLWHRDPPDRYYLKVHDAAVFFPFLLAWLGWLRWRLRRMRSQAGT